MKGENALPATTAKAYVFCSNTHYILAHRSSELLHGLLGVFSMELGALKEPHSHTLALLCLCTVPPETVSGFLIGVASIAHT